MSKLQQLLERTLEKYPELEKHKIFIKYEKLEDAYAMSALRMFGFDIRIDNSVKKLPDKIIIACIASELSHCVRDLKLLKNPNGIINDRIKYKLDPNYMKNDERETDIETVKRGLGYELLALMEYEESRGEDEDGEEDDGLTINELRQMLSNHPISTKRL